MDDYPYTTLGADGWFRCEGLHHPGFPTLFRDVLHRFGCTGFPMYHGRPYHQFGLRRCKVHVDIPAHPTDPTMMAWFTTARGDDLDDTLERATHQALTEFCEHHLPVLGDTAIALLPVRNEGNVVWSERVTAIGDPEFSTHNAGWALTTCYAQHVSSLLQEVIAMGAHLRLHLEECADQVKAKSRIVKDIQKGNRELLRNNARLETRIWELSDELMRTYHNRNFKTDDLNDTRTRLQHAQDELVAAQSYVHHLENELHERDEQLEASQAQVVDLQHQVEHLQELIPEEPEEPEEDPEEIEGMPDVDDD
jgi:GTP cyclohydrolase I